MRNFLVTKFVCAKCGSLLTLSPEKPPIKPSYTEGEPSGAFMHCSIVAVKPCEPCSRPVKNFLEALKEVTETSNE